MSARIPIVILPFILFACVSSNGSTSVTKRLYATDSGELDSANPTDCIPEMEICDEVDNDCDGEIDEDVQLPFYMDADQDGYGAGTAEVLACTIPAGYVDNGLDCDDSNADIRPGAEEICDGYDNNCDSQTDDLGICECIEERFDGHSYYLCPETVTWFEGRDRCLEWGMDLVILETAEENDWLTTHLGMPFGPRWWFGLSDLEVEGDWRWVDGSPLEFSSWHNAEPNDYGGNEDCGQLYLWDDNTWNDGQCEGSNGFICEAPQ